MVSALIIQILWKVVGHGTVYNAFLPVSVLLDKSKEDVYAVWQESSGPGKLFCARVMHAMN